jgi:hypothetical protein
VRPEADNRELKTENWELNYESPIIGKENLHQVQDRQAPRRGAGDLRELEAQAAAGLSGISAGGKSWRESRESIYLAPKGRRSG